MDHGLAFLTYFKLKVMTPEKVYLSLLLSVQKYYAASDMIMSELHKNNLIPDIYNGINCNLYVALYNNALHCAKLHNLIVTS